MRYDVVIAGAGLAGACAALWLSQTHRVCVLEKGAPGSGASGAAAGLVNPFMGRKAKRAWRADGALGALHATLDAADAAGLFHASGVLRPAESILQAEAFCAVAAFHPDKARWHTREDVEERWPGVRARHGALAVLEGGHVVLPDLIAALLRSAEANGATVQTGAGLSGWETAAEGVAAMTESGERVEGERLLLALGAGFGAFPELAALPLHRVKGQTAVLSRPTGVPPDLPPLSGGSYIVPGTDGLVVGATFEHHFATRAPTPETGPTLREKAAALLPALAGADVLEVRAGIRVTVPSFRLPLLGPLPRQPHVWVFTGLGAKGLLTAPLLAHRLARFFDVPTDIPVQVSTLRLGAGAV